MAAVVATSRYVTTVAKLILVIADLWGNAATGIVASIVGRPLEQVALVVIGELALLQTLIPADGPPRSLRWTPWAG